MAILLGDAFVRLAANDDQLDKDLASAKGKTESWAGGLAGSVAKFAGGAVLAGVGALVSGVAAIGTAAFNTASEFDAATKKMQSQLGTTEVGAENLREVMENVFANNFGDSIDDVADSITKVEQAFDRIGGTQGAEELQKATEAAIALRDAFDVEVNESTSAAVELMDKFGLSAEEAFDFIARGFQDGLNASDDFIDTIGEYSTQFANGGADAAQFFSLIQTGMAGGMLGTDKAADAFKEFRLRIQDGSKTTADGLKLLGLNAEQMTRDLASGVLTAADAFEIVLDRMREIEDPTIRMQAGAAVIGTQFEDLGDTVVRNMSLSAVSMDEFTGSIDKLNKQYETIPAFFEGLRRRALVAITPLGQAMLDAFNEALPSIEAWFTTVETWINDFIATSNFEWSPEFKQVKLGDLFEWMSSPGLGLSRIKIADWFDLTLGAEGIQQLTLADFFTFISGSGGGTSINLADFVTFIYDNTTGNVALTLADVFTFVSDTKKTVIRLNDYVTFTYDKESGGIALTLGDVFSFVDTEKVTTFNLADYVRFFWDDEKVKLKITDVVELDTTQGKEKLALGDFFELTGSPTENIVKINPGDLFGFATPITWDALVSLGEIPKITKLVFGDFFGFGGEGDKVTQDDLFDLSAKPPVDQYTLSDFIDFATAGKDATKFTIGDFFDFTANKPEGFVKMTVGDFVAFNNGEESKLSWGDIFELSSKPDVTKLTLGDLISFETDAAGNIVIESPVWSNFIEKLTWPEALTGFTWASFIDKLVWPTDTIDGFSWSSFIENLTWPLETIASFAWNTFITPLQWPLDSIRDFSWRDFITGIDFTSWVPDFPGWDYFFSWFGGGTPKEEEQPLDKSGRSLNFGRSLPQFDIDALSQLRSGIVVNVNIYGDVNSPADEEAIAYKVARRLAYT